MPIDFLITFVVMALLFMRQVAVFKQPNKINYAPLLLGVGAIGSMVHLLLHPENENFLLLFRESLLPLFAGLMLFIVMNILQQARQHRYMQTQQEFTQKLVDQVEQLQEYIGKLEVNQHLISAKEDMTRHKMNDIFEEEHNALETIKQNQEHFVGQINSIFERQEAVFNRLETFTQKEMPDLDNVVHRHIDMLRIAEQDHFNQLKQALKRLEEMPRDTTNEEAVHAIENGIARLADLQGEIGIAIGRQAGNEFDKIVEDLSQRFKLLKSQSESFSVALNEDENILRELRSQSELVMKQILLTAKSMDEVVSNSERVRELYKPLNDLIAEIENVHSDYVKAKVKLDMLTSSLQSMDELQIEKMREHIEELSVKLSERIDGSLQKLHEHYHIAQKDISQTVQELSSKAKIQQSYNVE
jgi:ABC-type transporter Mla subunit MlaD